VIAALASRAVVLQQKEIEGGDAAVGAEAHPGAARHVRAGMADVVLLLAADAHHDRRVGFLRQQGGDRHRHGAAALAAEAAARVLGDEHDVGRVETHPARQRVERAHRALRRPVQEQLAVLPVRHRAARLERLMARRLHDERLVEHERGAAESRVDVAVGPLLGRLAHRQLAVAGGGEVLFGPLQRADLRPVPCRALQVPCAGSARGRPDVASRAGVRTVRPEALERIGHERQRLEIERDAFYRFGGGEFVDGRDGQNRLALELRLVREGRNVGEGGVGEIVGREDGTHAGQRHGRGRVDAPDARVGHRAEQQLAEEHAVRAEVFRVAGPAGDLGEEIRRRVVPADQFLVSHVPPSSRHGMPGRTRRQGCSAWERAPG
jgi:hypothetical protein